MPIFLVSNPIMTTFKGGNCLVVSANDSAGALLAAAAQFGGDSSWAAATATQLSDVTMATANAQVGMRYRIVISTPATGAVVVDTGIITGDATNDTLDEIGVLLRDALNASAPISNATYTAGTQTLVAAAGASDALGDKHVRVYVFLPLTTAAGGQVNQDVDVSASFVSSITHQGVASADLTVVFVADTVVIPRVLAVTRRQIT